MPRERENFSKKIKAVDYNISGNRIRAFYDKSHDLIFVLDKTINANKPNVLLVIDSFDERKWDDVLSNDYGIDLETVRPKKDNKYQKLDIEYGGLDVYAELIDAYESDGDLDDALENLKRFRIMSVRRSAQERLAAAEDTATKSRETIERTDDAIAELRARLKELKSKLVEQKRNIGREPTKTSAAKILKTEALIDATNEKLARAKKRLEKAKRRLANAEDDAEIARAILARLADIKPGRHVKVVRASKPARTVARQTVIEEDTDNDVDEEDEDDDYADVYEPQDAEEFEQEAEEEVKPLFDTDPEILDDNIAFKPIEFDDACESREPVREKHDDPVIAPVPLSFTPPASANAETHEPNTTNIEITQNNNTTSMLDSLTPVEQPQPEQLDVTVDVEPATTGETVEHTDTNAGDTNVNINVFTAGEPETDASVQPTPVAEITPIEPIAPVRPVSPINEYDNSVEVRYEPKKPTWLYYIMLILLIGLSIFTLWLYQQKNGATVPDLATPTVASESTEAMATKDVSEADIPSPFVATTVEKTESADVEPTPIVDDNTAKLAPTTDVQPVSVEPESQIVVMPEPEPVAVVAEPEPVAVVAESPFVELRTVATYEPEKEPVPSEEEILAKKPGYNVSQNEKMFVAASDYDTEPVDSMVGNNMDVSYSMDTDVQPMLVAGPVPEIVASEVTMASVGGIDEDVGCANGVAPDANGCCPGEEYMYADGAFACCADDGCFPPLR